MSNKHYFQVKNFEYTHDAFKIGRTGVIAYIFSIIPDGQGKAAFNIQVIFPGQIVKQMGEVSISGTHFLTESAKPVFLRHAFNILKAELEMGGLDNTRDIVVNSEQIAQMKKALPRQCDFLEINGKEWTCQADKRHILPTAMDTCEACVIPEMLFRCAHLRVKTNWGEEDTEGKWQITPDCFCGSGKTLPVDLVNCQELYCYTPFKFYLPEKGG